MKSYMHGGKPKSIEDVKVQLLEGRKINPLTGCWEWQGCRNKTGYGWLSVSLWKKPGKSCAVFGVHRLSAHFWKGFDLASKERVLHDCDNPPCYNPGHLYYGDQFKNMQDASRKGHCSRTRITPDQVREARRLLSTGFRISEAARKLGISSDAVRHIKDGRSWKWVA